MLELNLNEKILMKINARNWVNQSQQRIHQKYLLLKINQLNLNRFYKIIFQQFSKANLSVLQSLFSIIRYYLKESQIFKLTT
jgi:hypothetical protein